jgi:hypothetical protein
MPAFKFGGEVREDGSWRIDAVAPNGTTVPHTFVARVLVLALAHYTEDANARLLTEAEVLAIEASRSLPEGWAATADGVNTYQADGVVNYTRTYARNGLAYTVIEVPCAADGSPTPRTREVLLAASPPPTPEA